MYYIMSLYPSHHTDSKNLTISFFLSLWQGLFDGENFET